MILSADIIPNATGLKINIDTPPTKNAASIEVARDFARIDSGIDDVLVQSLMGSATEMVEAYISRKLITQTINAFWEVGASRIYLPFGNVNSITQVDIIDSKGVATTTTNYTLKGDVIFIDELFYQSVNVKYVTGYGADYNSVPELIRQAIYKIITTDYDNRENLIVGESVMSIPNNWKNQLKQFINYES